MLLNHLFGFYTHPQEEWQSVDRKKDGPFFAMGHVAIIALIPTLVAYYSAAHLGWSIGAGDVIKLTQQSAVAMAIGMYAGLVGGVVVLALMIQELAKAFDTTPTFTQSLELAAYTATPLFMVGFAGLYPELWFVMMAVLAGVSYSVYLLYSGVPILMHMPKEKGFIYASSVVTCGLVLLVILMALSVIMWSSGFGPVYVH